MVQCPMNRPRNHRTLLAARTSRRSTLPLLATSSPISHFGALCFLSLAHSSAISWGWGVDCPAAVVPRLATRHSPLVTRHFPTYRNLPFSVSRNSFVCHSYANCRGVCHLFPIWNAARWISQLPRSRTNELVPPSLSIAQLPPAGSILWIAP